jgi:cell division transport system ATP-binding protein
MSQESIISINNVSIFQSKSLILSDVNLNINKGEFVYLIGKTGSGKSSLMKILYAEIPLTKGDATVVDYNLSNIKYKDIPMLRRKIGIVFQDFKLLTDRTINENLQFVLEATGWKKKDEIQKRIQEVLDKVNLGNKGLKMPFEISGGEQQRVAIARALLNDPELILADEPTGNLDPETSEEILNLLTKISKNGRAVLIATHDIVMFSKFPSRTIKCENGKVIEVNKTD